MSNLNNDSINNLDCFILQNNLLHFNNYPIIIPNSMNYMTFIQKKRMFEYYNLYNNNLDFLKEYINLNSINKNNFQLNEFPLYNIPEFEFNPQIKKSLYFNVNNSNLKELEFNINKENKIENGLNNNINEITYINKNDINGIFNKDIINQENKSFNYNINNNANIKCNINNNVVKSQYINNKTSLKNNYIFTVTRAKVKRPKKKYQKYIKQTESNNEIKVLKNKKIVYVNTLLLNSYSTSKNIKQLNKITVIGKSKRSSQYRGVSKNGNQWQVLMMLKKKKSYIGSYDSEEVAGRVYDILSIKNRGIKAKTNFIYTSEQIKNICNIDIDIKNKNLYEIISHLVV
jgi:hypothetical protein